MGLPCRAQDCLLTKASVAILTNEVFAHVGLQVSIRCYTGKPHHAFLGWFVDLHLVLMLLNAELLPSFPCLKSLCQHILCTIMHCMSHMPVIVDLINCMRSNRADSLVRGTKPLPSQCNEIMMADLSIIVPERARVCFTPCCKCISHMSYNCW